MWAESGDHRTSLMTGAYGTVCSRCGNETILATTRGFGGCRPGSFRKSATSERSKIEIVDSIWSDGRSPLVVTTATCSPSGEGFAFDGSLASAEGSLKRTIAMSSLTENG